MRTVDTDLPLGVCAANSLQQVSHTELPWVEALSLRCYSQLAFSLYALVFERKIVLFQVEKVTKSSSSVWLQTV